MFSAPYGQNFRHKVKALSKSPKSAVLALDLSSAKKHCLHREQTLSRYTVQVSCMKCFGKEV